MHRCISEQMIALLEDGIVPWHISWGCSGIPSNLLTKRPYRGINVLLLAAKGYHRNYFLTEHQIERIGAFVCKGQKQHIIVDGIGFRSLRLYEVYNIEQCGDIPKILVPRCPQQNSPIKKCKKVIEGVKHCPRLVLGDTIPSYNLSEDIITMPSMRYFASHKEYFDEFFKQLVAATKHWARLDRHDDSLLEQFVPEIMATEELVIEIGSWYLRSYTDIEVKRHCDDKYIRHWMDMFKKNLLLAFEAAEIAQKAVDYILGQSFDEKEAIDYVEDEMLPF